MSQEDKHLETLADIRNLMRESSQFLSLSGLSGIFAGVFALIGAFLGKQYYDEYFAVLRSGNYTIQTLQLYVGKMMLICIAVAGASFSTALYFTYSKAKKNNRSLFDHTSIKLLKSMLVPLVVGGIFCLAMLYKMDMSALFIAPAMLLFYGIALVNSSKYTLHNIEVLGYAEIALGLIGCFKLGIALPLWTLGFGVFHIIYGVVMWYKYDRHD
jgi:hypothetical protein